VRREADERKALARELCATGEWAELAIEGIERRYVCTRGLREICMDPPPVRGVHLLAPLDNLLWDRRRLLDLFGFPYTWEAYTPAVKRHVGPYGMPVLVDGQLVAEIDARRDAQGLLRWRLLERQGLRGPDRRRIGRAVAQLARDLGTEALAMEEGVAASRL
jgi:uncharacterized protein YcaQ